MFYKKQRPNIIEYRNYKTFTEQIFRTEKEKKGKKVSKK